VINPSQLHKKELFIVAVGEEATSNLTAVVLYVALGQKDRTWRPKEGVRRAKAFFLWQRCGPVCS